MSVYPCRTLTNMALAVATTCRCPVAAGACCRSGKTHRADELWGHHLIRCAHLPRLPRGDRSDDRHASCSHAQRCIARSAHRSCRVEHAVRKVVAPALAKLAAVDQWLSLLDELLVRPF